MSETGSTRVRQERIFEVAGQPTSVSTSSRFQLFAVAVSGKVDEQIGTDAVDAGRVVSGRDVAHHRVVLQLRQRPVRFAKDAAAQ